MRYINTRAIVVLIIMAAIGFTLIAVASAQDSKEPQPTSVTTTEVAAQEKGKKCPKVSTHNKLLVKTLKFWHKGPDYRYVPADKERVAKLGEMRACMKKQNIKHYKMMRGAWEKRSEKYTFHKRIDILTPYGPWAIPAYIVYRESRYNRCARNSSSTAGGFYQFIDSTWYSYGGKNYGGHHPAACAPDWHQHEVAARAWAGGSGRSHWALTA